MRLTVERSIFSSVARKIRERCEPKDHLQQSINQPHLHSILRAFGLRVSYRLTFVLFCFFLNTFTEAKALHLRSIILRYAGAPTTKKCFFLFPFCLFWRCRFFPSIFCTIAIFSLYGEYVVRFFLPDGVFSRSALFS